MRAGEALAAALLVSAGLASLGRRIAGAGERGFAGWNSRFQIGAGAAAIGFFPLSLVAGRFALAILAGLLAALLSMEAAARVRSGSAKLTIRFGWPEALLAAAVLLFAVLNARIGTVTDGISIWGAKANAIFQDGALAERLADFDFLGRNATYPPLVPLFSALVAFVCRRFDADVAKAFAPVFFASLLGAVYSAARRVVSRRAAAAAAAIVAFLPAVSTDWNAGGFADLPLAALVAGAAAALLGAAEVGDLPGWSAGWHLAALTAVKAEGTILALVAAFVAATASGIRRVSRLRRPAAVLGAAILVRLGYIAWLGSPDRFYVLERRNPVGLLRAFPPIAAACAAAAADVRLWGPFWPAVLAMAAILAARGSPAEKRLAAGVALAAGLDAAIFLFSTWDSRRGVAPWEAGISRQIEIAYPRLLEQIAGVASVVLVAGWSRMTRRAERPAENRG